MNEHKDTSAVEPVDSNEQDVTLADFERTEALPLADTQPTQTMPTTQTTQADAQDDTVAMPQVHAAEGDTAVLPAMETNTDAADTTTVLPQSAGDDGDSDAQTVTMPHVATETGDDNTADTEIDDADSATIDFGAFDDVTLETPESEPSLTADTDGEPADTPADTPASASTPGAQSVPLYSTAQPQSAPGPYVQVPSMQFEPPVIQKTGLSSGTIVLGVFMLIIGLIGLIIGLYGVTLPLTLLSWISDDPRVLFAIGCASIGGLLILVAIIWSIIKVISNSRSNKSTTDQA
ncbi:hypothetical protein D2E25_1371 [Bifidobacterium goeldii]|uniref:Uncharacterized protein n=1 Tax=Bifidobacterium goeldii TaxID=2306975 RepID=A0A430FJ25_9BIFI|nr:hypothetical protein [Bifidobacterium goeldii]RSX52800.1 hypothetical protein D2E25_1371 [Bifidobacterium goeldii]